MILLIPALCDMTATSTMYVGLTLTYASSFQMLRGSVIIFVALLSYLFLGRRPVARQLFGIFFIIVGLSLVGLADILSSGKEIDTHKAIIGDCLIVIAQVITACQMVFEEKFVGSLDIPPLQAVGWEGFFGFTVLSSLLVPMYFIVVPESFGKPPYFVIEDAFDAFMQISNNHYLQLAILGTITSIAFFNFAGISVTKEISATTRMVLDSVRTLVIWIVSLSVKWQEFHPIQVYGFASLLFGMSVYNDILVTPLFRACLRRMRRSRSDAADEEPIINQQADA
jgi:drug/metabolite transporter (DMT)-like permease